MYNFDLMLNYYKNKKTGTRNFYDSNQNWTDYSAIDLTEYNSLKFQITFKVPTNFRGDSNDPIFGASGGNSSLIFISRNTTNKILIYTYQSTGRYVFIPTNISVTTIVPDSWNFLQYEVSTGDYGKVTTNENSYTFGSTFSGFPSSVKLQQSRADCYIKDVRLYSGDNLIWKANSSDLR